MTKEKEILTNAQSEMGRFIPVSKWEDYHKYPTVKSLRQLIFFKKKNGFSKVLRKIGGRLYISENEFFKWIDETGKVTA